MTASLPGDLAGEQAFLDSVEGEIAFFRSIMRTRPIGLHRHFHLLAVRNGIHKDTGKSLHIESLWDKLRTFYDLDALEAIEIDAENYPSPSNTTNTTPKPINTPSPSDNLSFHPFFREEFTLPYDDFEPIISQRRLRSTVSLPSSPAPSTGSPAPSGTASHLAHLAGHRGSAKPVSGSSVAASTSGPAASGRKRTASGARKRGKNANANAKSKLNLAGLVGGDSDSSALTQESGDEGAGGAAAAAAASGLAGTPRESVVTGTDAGTDYGEDEDVEMREVSPAQDASPKPARGRAARGGRRGRGAAAVAARGASVNRGKKKQKR